MTVTATLTRPPVLVVDGLRVEYETATHAVEAVRGISFDIQADEVLGLVGESGSGKSTVCTALLGLLGPQGRIAAGAATFEGVDLLSATAAQMHRLRWRRLAYIPQGALSALNPVMRIGEHFRETIRAHVEPARRGLAEERMRDLLGRVHLPPGILSRYPHQISGGMRQRVCIALAMLLEPALVIADEPTSALDVISQRAVIEALIDERRRIGSSIILVGHDMAVQAQVADRIAIMYAGRLLEIGKARSIFAEPLHPYTQRLIASIPSVRVRQDVADVAEQTLSEAAKARFRLPATLVEVEPGHLVALTEG